MGSWTQIRVVLAHVPCVFQSFMPVIVQPYARLELAYRNTSVVTSRHSGRLIPIAPRLRALVLITIFKFRPTCAQSIRPNALNGRVIAVDTLACMRVRDVRAWFIHESYIGISRKRLLAKHSTAIANNSLLDRIRHASVARVPDSGSFLITNASSRSVFNANKLNQARKFKVVCKSTKISYIYDRIFNELKSVFRYNTTIQIEILWFNSISATLFLQLRFDWRTEINFVLILS